MLNKKKSPVCGENSCEELAGETSHRHRHIDVHLEGLTMVWYEC